MFSVASEHILVTIFNVSIWPLRGHANFLQIRAHILLGDVAAGDWGPVMSLLPFRDAILCIRTGYRMPSCCDRISMGSTTVV